LIAAATVAASLILAAGATGATDVILPGVADLPVIAGQKAGGPCAFLKADFKRTATQDCVAMRGKDVDPGMQAYTRALIAKGWTFAGGAAIQFWFERKRPEGDCERINMSGVVDFEKPEAEILKGPGTIVFQHEPQGACRKGQGS